MDNKITLEEQIWAKEKLNDEYEQEEFIDDYLPRVKRHIGFEDNRQDHRFVVKFHDVCYYTHTQDMKEEKADMDDETFDTLFEMFCDEMYESTTEIIKTDCMSLTDLFATYDVGHYRTFAMVIPKITEDNYLQVALEIYEEGLAPAYIDDYTKLADYLQDMEDNYMQYWLDFLRDHDIPETTIKNIERRYEKDKNKEQ